jgi:hypothetical protein
MVFCLYPFLGAWFWTRIHEFEISQKFDVFLCSYWFCLLFSILAILPNLIANEQIHTHCAKIYILVNIYHSPFDSHLVLNIEGQIYAAVFLNAVKKNKYYIELKFSFALQYFTQSIDINLTSVTNGVVTTYCITCILVRYIFVQVVLCIM